MIIQYKYFDDQDIIDQEDPSLFIDIPEDDIIYLDKAYLTSKNLEFLIPYFSKYTNTFPLLKTPGTEIEYSACLFFTEDEYTVLKDQQNHDFTNGIYHSIDRLALDENGVLYDISEEEPKSFKWYVYNLIYTKSVIE